MSAVRMCDRCGNIFSERADGWTTMIAQKVKRTKGGATETQAEHLDACPMCSNGESEVQPTIKALTPGAGVDRIADTLTDPAPGERA